MGTARTPFKLLMVMAHLPALAFIIYLLAHHHFEIRDSDVEEANLSITRWILGETSLKGHTLEPNDLPFYVDEKIAFSFNGFAPPFDIDSLGTSCEIVVDDGSERLFDIYGYGKFSYLEINEEVRARHSLHYSISIRFGTRGGHGYDVTVTRGLLGLRFHVQPTWIS